MRQLHKNQRCEHEALVYNNGALEKVTCDVRHLHREPGQPPRQLVPVKDGRSVRFMCLVHAPMHTTVREVKRKNQKSKGANPTQGDPFRDR